MKDPEQIVLSTVMEMNPRFFQQQNAALVSALARGGKFPGKRDMPAKAVGSPMQSNRHSKRLVLGKDVERRAVDLDVEMNLLLGPEILKLPAEVSGRRPQVKGSGRTPFSAVAFGQEVVDIQPGKIQNDLDGLLFVAELVPPDGLQAIRKPVELDLRAAEPVLPVFLKRDDTYTIWQACTRRSEIAQYVNVWRRQQGRGE